MSLIEVESRFRERGALSEVDCAFLRSTIRTAHDASVLESAIYLYGRCCGFNADVLLVCERYMLREPVPGLTAVCMRVVFDYWGRWVGYGQVVQTYLNVDLYDDWYDEVIFVTRFALALSTAGTTEKFDVSLKVVRELARDRGVADLLRIFHDGS